MNNKEVNIPKWVENRYEKQNIYGALHILSTVVSERKKAEVVQVCPIPKIEFFSILPLKFQGNHTEFTKFWIMYINILIELSI